MPEDINPEPTEAEEEDVDVVAHGVGEEDATDPGRTQPGCIINNSSAL